MSSLHELIMGNAFGAFIENAQRETTNMQDLALYSAKLAQDRISEEQKAEAERTKLAQNTAASIKQLKSLTDSGKLKDAETTYSLGKDGTIDMSVKIGGGSKTDNNLDIPDNIQPLSPFATQEQRDQWISQLDPITAENVKGLSTYTLDPSKTTSLRGDQRRKIAGLTKMYDPNFDMKTYDERNAFLKKWDAYPYYVQTQQSLDLVANHLSNLDESLTALDNGNVILANTAKNTLQHQAGQSQIAKAMVDAKAVSTEFAKTLKGSGVLAEKEASDWEKRISTSASPDQIKDVNSELIDLITPRYAQQLRKYKSVMGIMPKDVFSPEAINAIQRLSKKKLPKILQEYIDQQNNDGQKSVSVGINSVESGNQLKTSNGTVFSYKLKGQ